MVMGIGLLGACFCSARVLPRLAISVSRRLADLERPRLRSRAAARRAASTSTDSARGLNEDRLENPASRKRSPAAVKRNSCFLRTPSLPRRTSPRVSSFLRAGWLVPIEMPQVFKSYKVEQPSSIDASRNKSRKLFNAGSSSLRHRRYIKQSLQRRMASGAPRARFVCSASAKAGIPCDFPTNPPPIDTSRSMSAMGIFRQ
jgi:hypothetical protein